MNPPSPTQHTSTNLKKDESKQVTWRIKLIISAFLLTIAADFLTFGIPLGVGATLLFGLVWIGLKLNRPSIVTNWKDGLLFFLMTVSAIQTTIEPSFSNWLVLFILTVYASGHFLRRQIAPYWRRALEGLFSFLNFPLAYFNLKRSLQDAKNSIGSSSVNDNVQYGRRWSLIILPTIVITISFLILFGNGNAVMGGKIKSMLELSWFWISDFDLPSPLRIMFWISIGFALVALLSTSPLPLDLTRITKRFPRGWRSATDISASIWSTRILLVSVNAIFFAANSTDVFFLWMETELPTGINFSEYVHQGVYNLISCVALAAGILLVVFQQDKQVTGARGQKLLAHIWITQNFLLVSSVLLRLKLYVDTYHLSLLRLYVAFFLILVVVGFILLAIKIERKRDFAWLVNSNLLAVFLLFFFVQLINDRAFVAQYNFEQALRRDKESAVLDIDYLVYLGPAAWPVLKQVADDASQFGSTSESAKSALLNASYEEQGRLEGSDWRSWQYRRWTVRHSLPGFENTSESQISFSTR